MGKVLALQKEYASANTPAMNERGQIIRKTHVRALEELRPLILRSLKVESEDLLIEGKDGAGRKSIIPWVRIASRSQSPRATEGWYVVWLYRADGDGVYLTLAHGSTQFVGGSFVARNDREIGAIVTWARSALAGDLKAHPGLVYTIDLASPADLAVAYSKTSLAAFYYPADALPEEAQLDRDISTMTSLLRKLYLAESLGKNPVSPPLEVAEAEAALLSISKPSARGAGQAFGLDAASRRQVELRAMEVASAHLKDKGYEVRDVSATESFDILASNSEEVLYVEVKGTTGHAGAILLTANEVELHRRVYPRNALLVVYEVSLERTDRGPLAHGGTLLELRPWKVVDDRLTPSAFVYSLSPVDAHTSSSSWRESSHPPEPVAT